MLRPLGFTVDRPIFAEPGTPDIENLYATARPQRPASVFAGHTDVVPPGDEAAWTHPPFAAEIADGELYGRGAVDMKGGIACFVAALRRHIEAHGAADRARSRCLITGDEEGPAINGTVKLLEWAAARGEHWDAALVGEPTNPGRARRHDQDRPARLAVRHDHGQGRAGPRRLSASRRQPGARR